jgi:hypothetical protein
MILKLFYYGFILGCTWEFTFDILGDDFCSINFKGLLVFPGTRGLSHALWDGSIFMIGYYLCIDLLKKPHFTQFSFKELMIMFIWGNL